MDGGGGKEEFYVSLIEECEALECFFDFQCSEVDTVFFCEAIAKEAPFCVRF